MNSHEINKIAGAILAAALTAVVAGQIAGALINVHELEENVFVVGGADRDVTADLDDAADEAPSIILLMVNADPAAGEKVARKCASCHSFNDGGANKVGPNLWNIVGAPIAEVEGYSYSDSLAELGGDWTYDRLNQFLAQPKLFAPGTKMGFAGLKKVEDRVNLIAWLRQQSLAPATLPAEETTAEAETVATEEAPAAEEAAATDGAPLVALFAGADSAAGAKLARKCTSCHNIAAGAGNKVGPNLWNVVGAEVAGIEGYKYSAALDAFGGTWSYDRLYGFLEKPRNAVPGTKMTFAGFKDPQQIADLLTWLGEQSDDPVAPPR